MAIALSTAGIRVKYATESTAGTKPSSGFIEIINVVEIPEFGSNINTLDATDLAQTKNHKYIPALADTGGSIQLTVNDGDAFRTIWDAAVTAYEGLTGGKKMWFEYVIPGMTKSFYYPGRPMPLGFGGASVDSVYQNIANIIHEGDYEWDTAST